MKIELILPVYAQVKFEADINIEGKDSKQIFNEFLEYCEASEGGLCHQCSRGTYTDSEIRDEVFSSGSTFTNDLVSAISDQITNK